MNARKTEQRLKQSLAEVEQAVSAGELELKQQRAIVEERLRFGSDLEHAMTRLANLEKSQQFLLKEIDRLRDEQAEIETAQGELLELS